MKKIILFILLLIGIFASSVASYYLISTRMRDAGGGFQGTGVITDQRVVGDNSNSKLNSFMDESLECNWSEGENRNITLMAKDGVFYAQISIDGSENEVIVKSGCSYTWSSAPQYAYKRCFGEEVSQIALFDYDYECVDSDPPNEIFIIPQNLDFVDLAEAE